MEIELTKQNYKEVVENSKTVLIDFYANWCGPCKLLGPVIASIAKERNDVAVCKVNVDEERDLARDFRVMSIPHVVVMKDGKVVKTSTGYKSKKAIEGML